MQYSELGDKGPILVPSPKWPLLCRVGHKTLVYHTIPILETSVEFRNLSRSSAVSSQATEAINPALGGHHFPPGRGYLPSLRASPPVGRYRIILLGDRSTCLWTTWPGLHSAVLWQGLEPATCWSQVWLRNRSAGEPHFSFTNIRHVLQPAAELSLESEITRVNVCTMLL